MKSVAVVFGGRRFGSLLKTPYLEITIMLLAVVLSFLGLAVLAAMPEVLSESAMPTSQIVLIQLAFFLLSVSISVISVIAGIGGGVIFTPIMLAFTMVDSVIVRTTGLIVAMFSGLISTGVLIDKGLGNYRLVLVLTISQALGALGGSVFAVTVSERSGNFSEGLMRTLLGAILALICIYLLLGSRKQKPTDAVKIGGFTRWLGLDGSYYEESEGVRCSYKVKRAGLGIILFFFVGIIGGFFGMGGGWAITPLLNMGMDIPLKLAAANSHIILGMGSCVSIWPYIYAGGLIPLFVLPWLSGQVVGGFIGSFALARMKVFSVRIILIGIMIFTSFSLVSKGLDIMGFAESPSPLLQVAIFAVIIASTIAAVVLLSRKENSPGKTPASVLTEPRRNTNAPSLPLSVRTYSKIVKWLTILSALTALLIPVFILFRPDNNVLNPNMLFSAIFDGAAPREIWSMSETGAFPGGHYYFSFITKADSWAQLAVGLGCSVGLWALIPAVLIQFFKEKNRFYALLGLALIVLIMLSMLGVF